MCRYFFLVHVYVWVSTCVFRTIRSIPYVSFLYSFGSGIFRRVNRSLFLFIFVANSNVSNGTTVNCVELVKDIGGTRSIERNRDVM